LFVPLTACGAGDSIAWGVSSGKAFVDLYEPVKWAIEHILSEISQCAFFPVVIVFTPTIFHQRRESRLTKAVLVFKVIDGVWMIID